MSEHDEELTRAFVAVFESISITRGLLARKDREASLKLIDEATCRVRAALRLCERA